MSAFLYRLACTIVAHARTVLAAWLVALAALGVAVAFFGGTLTNDFKIPGTEGQAGLDILNQRFPELAGTSAQVVFGVPEGQQIVDHTERIRELVQQFSTLDHVSAAADPFDDSVMAPLVSANGRYALSQVQFDFSLDSIDQTAVNRLVEVAQSAQTDGMSVHVGGQVMSLTEIPLSIMEVVGVILALLVLAFTFRSLIAAAIPIFIALLAVGVAMCSVLLLAAVVPISTTTPTLAIMLGLAVGIDYSLFILSRHRDQLAAGLSVKESIPRAIATSGGAVIFAGSTVVIALIALIVGGIPFLSIMGLCAAFAVAVAAMIAVTGLPALLTLVSDRLRPHSLKRARQPHLKRRSWAELWVNVSTAHPWLTILAVTSVLAALAVPSYALRLALPDNGVEDESTMARQTYDLVAKEFGEGANGQLLVITDIITSTDPLGLMDELADEIATFDDVESIQLATPNRGADLGVVIVIPREGPESVSTERLVHQLRAAAPKWEKIWGISKTKVTGAAAVAIDVSEQLFSALLPFGLIVVGLSLALLMMVFRSLWVPLKATVGYLLSVGAAFGVTTLVFIFGWANDALLIGQVGPVLSFMPIILMGVLFGLAMDYEVFLVSRIREDFVHGGDARAAIRSGFNASASVVMAAALIMISVFSGFIPSGSFYVQPIAFGLAVGVLVDAFLVRMTLVPAVLQLLGKRAWRFPSWLDRAVPTFDVEGQGMDDRFKHLDWQRQFGTVVARAAAVVIRDRHRVVVDSATVAIRPGEVVRLEGDLLPTRCLALALAGRIRIDAGTMFVFDNSVVDEPSRVVARTRLLSVTGDYPSSPTKTRWAWWGRASQSWVCQPCLFVVDRPVSQIEAAALLHAAEDGSAVVLTPTCQYDFPQARSVYVPTKLAAEVVTK